MDLADKLNAIKMGEDTEVENEVAPIETESLETQAPETEIETAPEVEAQPEAVETTEEVVEGETEAAPWMPTLKYKVLKEEHDFPDWSKEFVKTKEVEEQFIDLFTKANALEHQKKRRSELEDQFAELSTTHDTKMQDAQQLAQIVADHNQRIASNNPGEQLIALQNSGLNEKAILDIARHVLELQKLDPNQRQAYDMQFQQREQLNQYQSQLEQTQANLRAAEINNAQANLTAFLSSRSDVVSEYEAREGNNEGDFQMDFINFGVTLQKKLGKEIEWKEAMKQFKKVHALGKPKSKPAPAALPNLKSTGHSPVERSFRSMDDLRSHMESSKF